MWELGPSPWPYVVLGVAMWAYGYFCHWLACNRRRDEP
jgi:hypothetical protein